MDQDVAKVYRQIPAYSDSATMAQGQAVDIYLK